MSTKNQLKFAEQFALANFIKENYISSEMYDDVFAEHATRNLKFVVTTANVGSIRRSLNMPSNYLAKVKEPDVKRIERLEEEVRKLWVRLQHLIDGTTP